MEIKDLVLSIKKKLEKILINESNKNVMQLEI